ncbi:MAG: helix-turn-helix domain-containing protein [Emergencia timonensis]|mgnify:CR=1 FL=1|uniref:helix-turn-helix domain-containing protein n=1 Tax=Emergencia timonensis TaxID=1776384 RepID=UPI00082FDFAB|nr:helix-turn-helix domain-containing protein [Emergencia timonensis]WNX86995.1 AraC family transcriptional regulator [Emergencia timonensis]
MTGYRPQGNHNDIREQRLLREMKAFAYTANVPVTLYDNNMNILWECRPELKICTMFLAHDIRNNQCNENLKDAIATAESLNEPYVFMCASRLTQIAYPVKIENSLKGTMIAGPIIMGKNRENALKHIFENLPDYRTHINELLEIIEANPIRTTLEVSCIYEVFCDCIFAHNLMENSQPSGDAAIDDLLQSLQKRDLSSAVAAMDIIFQHAYIANGGKLNLIKVYLSDYIASLPKQTLQNYVFTEGYETLLSELKGAATAEKVHDICRKIAAFMTDDDDRHPQYKGSSHVIEETILYLEEHYADDIELKGIADQVHVNTSYLSSLFKKETSMTFSQYLNMIRLNQSVKLLKTTDLPLEQVAKRCGFASQSYYIRAFKLHYKETPGKYRRDFKDKSKRERLL